MSKLIDPRVVSGICLLRPLYLRAERMPWRVQVAAILVASLSSFVSLGICGGASNFVVLDESSKGPWRACL